MGINSLLSEQFYSQIWVRIPMMFGNDGNNDNNNDNNNGKENNDENNKNNNENNNEINSSGNEDIDMNDKDDKNMGWNKDYSNPWERWNDLRTMVRKKKEKK